jgi:lambda repressor-like predicted transcriptional regulator
MEGTRPITPLKRAIFESGRTQKSIAEEAGLSESAFSRFVYGLHAPDDTKRAIADALSRRVSELWPETADERNVA